MSEQINERQPAILLPQAKRRRSSLPILVLAVLFVSATFLTWYYTWFGRDLTDQEISQYLADEKHPRHVQHALLQIEQRLEKGDDGCCRQWYPAIQGLTSHPETEFRMTAAWLMGYDNKSDQFHQSLLKLLGDKEPMVRRNASLALVRFNDASGREELLSILKPQPVSAPVDGVINSTLNEGSLISRGTLLARIEETNGAISEVRSPLPGRIEKITSGNGSRVGSGTTILTLSSDATSIWEALRGLALIGKADDLNEIERYAQGIATLPERIKKQAALTAKAIQSRSAQGRGQGQNGQAGQKSSLTQ
ncbi:MAG: biotin/lipoyl attachment protein [Acidobacteria bacterium]|nr:biotin/lipoyl attachment protein [Acidobacteriota bacterium]